MRAQRRKDAAQRRQTAIDLSYGLKARAASAAEDGGLVSVLRRACEGETGLRESTVAVDMLRRGALPEDAAVAAGLVEASAAPAGGGPALFPGSRPRSVRGLVRTDAREQGAIRTARRQASRAMQLQATLGRSGSRLLGVTVGDGSVGGRLQDSGSSPLMRSPMRTRGGAADASHGGATRPACSGTYRGIGGGGGGGEGGDDVPAALFTLDPALLEIGGDGGVAGRVGAAPARTRHTLGAAALTQQTGVLGQWERVRLERVFEEADEDGSG